MAEKTKREDILEMDGPLPENLVENWDKFLFVNCQVCNSDGKVLAGSACGDCRNGKLLVDRSIDDLFADGWLFPLQRKAEMLKMHELARSIHPQTLFEIGADKGGSVWAWCKALPTLRNVIVCEIRGTPYQGLFEEAFPGIEFVWLPESSYSEETVAKLKVSLNWGKYSDHWQGKIDVLFLDGDKSYYDRDFDCYRPLVSDNGLVFFHDIVDNIPPRAHWLNLMHQGYETQEIIDFSDVDAVCQLGHMARNSYEAFLQHWKRTSMGVGVVRMKV